MRWPSGRALLEGGIWWALMLCLWLIFVSGVPVPEVLAGAVAAAMAAALGILAWRAAEVRFGPRPRWLFELRHLPLRVVLDTVDVFGALGAAVRGRPVRGRWLTISQPVRAADRRTSARRALLTLLVSFTPNTIVVDFDDGEGQVLVHQLTPGSDRLPVDLR